MHVSQLLNAPTISLDPDIKVPAELTHSAENDLGEFTTGEIHRIVRKLKGNKVAGVGGIPVELLRRLGPSSLLWLQTLFSVIWRIELVPSDWQKALFYHFGNIKGANETVATIVALLVYYPWESFCFCLVGLSCCYLNELENTTTS